MLVIFANTVNYQMGIVERRQRQKEEVRSAILSSAWNLVQEEGWQSLSIRKIADAIEYSIPVIYNHFENKEAILLVFTKEGFQKLADKMEKARARYPEPCKQLEAMANTYWDFAFDHKEYYQLMFGLGIPACDRVNQVAEMKALTVIMISSIEEAIANSKNPDADHFLKYHTYWSILHGLVSIQMIEKEGKPDASKKLILDDAVAGFIKSLME